MDYAGFWRRTAALTIDAVIFIILYIGLSALFSGTAFLAYWAYQILCAFYYVGMTASSAQGTLGQKILKVKIGNPDGSQLSLVQSVKRFVMWMLPAWPLIIYGGLPANIRLQEAMNGQFEMVNGKLENPADATSIQSTLESPEFLSYMFYNSVLGIIALIGGLIWAISIGVSKEKAGIYDKICKQRAFKRVKEQA